MRIYEFKSKYLTTVTLDKHIMRISIQSIKDKHFVEKIFNLNYIASITTYQSTKENYLYLSSINGKDPFIEMSAYKDLNFIRFNEQEKYQAFEIKDYIEKIMLEMNN